MYRFGGREFIGLIGFHPTKITLRFFLFFFLLHTRATKKDERDENDEITLRGRQSIVFEISLRRT